MRILFVTGENGRDELFYHISRELQCESHFISKYPRNTNYLQKRRVCKCNIHKLYIHRTDIDEPDMRCLAEAEKKYNFLLWDVWELARQRADFTPKTRPKKALCYMEYVIRRSEEILDKIKPDYVVFHGVSCYLATIFFHIAKRKSRVLEFVHARIKDRFAFTDNMQDSRNSLNREYKRLQRRKLTEEERKFALSYVNGFTDNPHSFLKPTYGKKLSRTLKIKKYWLKGLVADRRIPSDFSFVRRKLNEPELKRYFEEPVEGEKYVLYPLHMQPEVSTIRLGKYYNNQLSLIQVLSRCIPITHKLYVKEHHYRYGNRDVNFYREIKKLPNVRLISPSHSAIYDLIKKSSLVVTITGTTGFEALLFGKNVLTFGDVYYNIFRNVRKVRMIEQLPELIASKLGKEIDKEDVLKAIIALFRSSYKGLMTYPHGCNLESLEKYNIKRLVDGIRKETDMQDS